MTGAVPAAVAGLLAASAIVLLGLLTTEQAFRSVSWTTVVLVGGMISLSTAMVESGAAADLADELVALVSDAGPHALLLALFLLCAALGQLISNMATALIVIPIAISAAADMDVSAKPVLMTVGGVGRRGVPDPGRHAGEPDGDGTRRLPLRRLLEARPAAARAVRRRRRAPRAGRLGILKRGSATGSHVSSDQLERMTCSMSTNDRRSTPRGCQSVVTRARGLVSARTKTAGSPARYRRGRPQP